MSVKNKIVIYGGSFNPPINSHFSIAEQVLNQFEDVEKIIFVPVSCKYEKSDLAPDDDRYNMLKIATDKNVEFCVSDIDLHRERSLTTIEVTQEIKKQYPGKDVWILLGSDNLKTFSMWNNAEELISENTILVMERGEDSLEKVIENDELLAKYRNHILKISDEIRSNYSSTYIRQQIKNDKRINYLMPTDIYQYIKRKGLYK